jgi:hypothetical protein
MGTRTRLIQQSLHFLSNADTALTTPTYADADHYVARIHPRGSRPASPGSRPNPLSALSAPTVLTRRFDVGQLLSLDSVLRGMGTCECLKRPRADFLVHRRDADALAREHVTDRAVSRARRGRSSAERLTVRKRSRESRRAGYTRHFRVQGGLEPSAFRDRRQ